MRSRVFFCLALAACHHRAPEAVDAGKRLGEVLAAAPRKPEFDQKQEDLDARAESATRGYKKDGDEIAFSLDDVKIAAPVKARSCYRGVVRLGTDAVYSDLAERGLHFDVTLPGKTAARPSGGAVGPGAIFDLHCASVDGDAKVELSAEAAKELAPGAARSIGSGPATLQLYVRPADATDWSGGELKEMLTTELAGLSAVEKPVEGVLELPSAATFALATGWCYKLALVLRPGAAFGTGKGGLTVGTAKTLGPGAVADLGCISTARSQPLSLRPGKGGHGAYLAQLYARPANSDEVTAKSQSPEDTAKKRVWADQHRGDVCSKCSEERSRCTTSASTCENNWNACVRAGSKTNDSPYSYCK